MVDQADTRVIRAGGLKRRQFLGLATLSAGALLAACGSPSPTPTAAPAAPAPTQAPSAAPTKPAEAAAAPTKPAAAAAAPTAASAAPAAPTAAPKAPAATAKTGLQYQATSFNKNPIKLTIWDQSDARKIIFEKWFPKYTEKYPNVTVELTQVPDRRNKLVTAIPAKQGPDLFFIHGDWTDALVDSGLTAPLPDKLFPKNVLEETFLGMKAIMGSTEKYYWLPTGIMSAGLYYNKEILDKEGIKESEVPKTHVELMKLAQQLTVKDKSGRIERAGFNTNGWTQYAFRSMYYQKGSWLYTEDYKRAIYDTDENEEILRFLADVYDKYQVSSRDFLGTGESMGTGKAAMIYNTAWMSNTLRLNYPKIQWGILPERTWSGKQLPAAGGGAYDPQSLAVPANTPGDRMEVAFDLMLFLYSNGDFLVDNVDMGGTAPNVAALVDHPTLKKNPTVQALSVQAPYEVIEFGGPDEVESLRGTHIIDAVFKKGLSIPDALKQAQAEADRIMRRTKARITERMSYPYPDRMHFPKPRS